MDLRYLPPVAALVGLSRMVSGSVHFNRDRVGEVIGSADGERHRIFREMRLRSVREANPEPGVTLTLKFRFARFTAKTNRLLSLLPIPVIVGMPGFIMKTWTHCDETGDSQGIYRFRTREEAEAYRRSPIIKVLERRAVAGTLVGEIREGHGA